MKRRALLAFVLASTPLAARAAPEWNASVLAGAAGTGRAAAWSDSHFFGALHADALFGRARDGDAAIGPSLELGTVGFSDVRILGGPTVLIPLGSLLSLSATPGVYFRSSPTASCPGLSARAFFGARGYDFAGPYSLAGGLTFGFDEDLSPAHEHALVIAAQVDAALIALPVLLLYEWLRGPSD